LRPYAIATALVVLALAPLAPADPILSLANAPADYTPGQSFSFDVVLTGAADLASYNVVVEMTAVSGALGAGGDAWFVPPADPPTERYVFGGYSDYFLSQVSTAGGGYALVTSHWNDPDGTPPLDGVDTVAGVNDIVVHVTVATAATLADSLHLSLDAVLLELDTPTANVPVAGFDVLQADVAATGPLEVPEVPEPTVLLCLCAAAPALLKRRRSRQG